MQPARFMKEELLIRANATVAALLLEKLPEVALLRKQQSPQPKKLDQFLQRASRLGLTLEARDSASILRSIASLNDHATRKALEIFLVKACLNPKYVVAGSDTKHFAFNLPLYCHFTSPFNRYADVLTHRQLSAALDGEAYNEDAESLIKAAEHCNTKKDAARNAQDQSVHLMLCSMVDKLSAEGSVIRQAVVINVMDSSFDILLPEFGVEKRVHLDQLPLHKAEFDSKKRKLELYWMKGIDSATYIPADQQGKPHVHLRGATATEEKLLEQKMLELSSLTMDDEEALFKTAQPRAGGSSSLPPSSPPRRISEDERPATSTPSLPAGGQIKPFFSFEHLERRAKGDLVQHISELARVPVVLQADCLFKSPPLLLVRAINPFTRE
jgi:protein SSD1